MARTKSAKRKAARLAGKKADVKKAKKTQAKKAKKKTENSPKAKKNVNSNAFESLYGSIKKESKRWGKRTRAMVESAKIKAVEFKGGQRPGPKKKKQKKGKFSMKLPPLVPPGQVPWWKNPTAAPPESKKIKILNSISVDSQTMWLLNEELEAFEVGTSLFTVYACGSSASDAEFTPTDGGLDVACSDHIRLGDMITTDKCTTSKFGENDAQ